MDKTLYTEKSIESLSPLEFTRLRPQVYCGDTSTSTQLLIEILSNSIDEAKLGHGNLIEIKINSNGIIKVRDYGQGFLINSMRPDGKTVLEAAFSILNTSGKYREDGTYEGTSLGSFGIGSKITTYLSHWLKVTSIRDGMSESILFKEGIFNSREIDKNNMPTGTIVEWLPSQEFFTDIHVDIIAIRKLIKVIVCLCPGLTIKLNINENIEEYFSKNGLNDLVDEAVQNTEILKNRLIINFSDNKYKLSLALTYTKNYNSIIVPYVNNGLTQSGPHITQLKAILTKEMNKFFKEKGWLKEKEESLSGEDCQEGMYVVFNIISPGVAYDSQIKTRITKLDMKPFTSAITESLRTWMLANEKEIKVIADKALNARKAREAARKARESARGLKEKKESGLKAKMKLSDKFIDCGSRVASERNLLLVEGKSAASSAVEARNPKTDAIYMLRGKIISPLRTPIDKILANQEMSDIIRVIGAGFNETFDVNKMNFGKIVITSDMDPDGSAIELLLLTFFYRFMRPLIEAGKLYRAVTPYYIVRYKGKEDYCFTEEEMDQWKLDHPNIKYEVVRAKGYERVWPLLTFPKTMGVGIISS